METIEKVNFHYEYQLAGAQLPPSQILKINREYEYMALLWGGVQVLANVQDYKPEYLKKCEKLVGTLPQLRPSSQYFDRYFWGNVSEKRKCLNSKETSVKIAQRLNLKQRDLLFERSSDISEFLLNLQTPHIVRTSYSVSGRGVFVYYPGDEIESFIKRIEKEKTGGPIVVTPYHKRFKDFSVIMTDDKDIIVYETIVDSQGVFRGVLIDSKKVHSYKDWMSEEDFQVYREIYREYKEMGASQIQIDSFLYESAQGKNVFHLVEVNARKTMGELAYRLLQSQPSELNFFSFALRPKSSLQKRPLQNEVTVLSPESSNHVLCIDHNDDEKKARSLF